MNVRIMIGKWYGATLAMFLLCIVSACDEILLDTWDGTYPSSAVAECVFETSDGDIISSGIDRTDSTLTVLCTDRLGNAKWERTFSPVIGFRNRPSSVVRQAAGGYLVAYLNPQDLSLTAVTLDNTGETSGGWILPTGFHRIWSFDATENGFLVSGATECDFYSTENPNVCSDISPFNNVTTLFSNNGEILWSVEGPYYWQVRLTRDGGALCMGTDLSTETEKTRYGLVVKRGPDGSVLWSSPIKTGGLLLNTYTTPVWIDETDDGGVIYTARYGTLWIISTAAWFPGFQRPDPSPGRSIRRIIMRTVCGRRGTGDILYPERNARPTDRASTSSLKGRTSAS